MDPIIEFLSHTLGFLLDLGAALFVLFFVSIYGILFFLIYKALVAAATPQEKDYDQSSDS
jgi:hypothetical protein